MTDTSPTPTTAIAMQPKTKAKRSPGRPKADIPLDEVRRLAAQGMSAEQISSRLGCAERTLFLRMSEDPAARAAFHEGIAAGVDKASGKLWDMIEAGNLGAVIFYLRSRAGWRAAASQAEITVRHEVAPFPMIDDHVLRMAAEHTALLNSPDIDTVDAEFSEVAEFDLSAAMC